MPVLEVKLVFLLLFSGLIQATVLNSLLSEHLVKEGEEDDNDKILSVLLMLISLLLLYKFPVVDVWNAFCVWARQRFASIASPWICFFVNLIAWVGLHVMFCKFPSAIYCTCLSFAYPNHGALLCFLPPSSGLALQFITQLFLTYIHYKDIHNLASALRKCGFSGKLLVCWIIWSKNVLLASFYASLLYQMEREELLSDSNLAVNLILARANMISGAGDSGHGEPVLANVFVHGCLLLVYF